MSTEVALQWLCRKRPTPKADVAVRADQDQSLIGDTIARGQRAIWIVPRSRASFDRCVPADGIDLQEALPCSQRRVHCAPSLLVGPRCEEEQCVACSGEQIVELAGC